MLTFLEVLFHLFVFIGYNLTVDPLRFLSQGMHKKSMETPCHTSPEKPKSTQTPVQEPVAERGIMEDEDEERARRDPTAAVAPVSISKEELRENSIAALRAKAQEHSAKMQRSPASYASRSPDRKSAHTKENQEVEEDKHTAEPQTTHWNKHVRRLVDMPCDGQDILLLLLTLLIQQNKLTVAGMFSLMGGGGGGVEDSYWLLKSVKIQIFKCPT